jgi:hypothetical protein
MPCMSLGFRNTGKKCSAFIFRLKLSKGTMIFQTVGYLSPSDTLSHSKSLEFGSSDMLKRTENPGNCEPKIYQLGGLVLFYVDLVLYAVHFIFL